MHLQQSVVDLEVLLARIGRGELDPGWDGAPAWDLRRRQLLLDTVLRDWPMPPIVIASDDGRDVLLDGRERLRALWQFCRDELPLPDGLHDLGGLRDGELPERLRRRVRRYGVPVVAIAGHGADEVRELVSRWDPRGPQVPAARVPQDPPRRVDPPARPSGAHRRSGSSEPIFDELSAWFLDAASPPSTERATPVPSWSSPADPGHHAARSALQARGAGTTRAGLPIREPAAHLAPGAVEASSRSDRPRPHDPRAVGEHLTRLREGTAAARGDLASPDH